MAFEGGVEINTGSSKDEKSLNTRRLEVVSDDDDDGNDKITPETVSYDQYQRLANRLESLEREMARLDRRIPHPYENAEKHNLDKEYGPDGSYALLEAQRMPRPQGTPERYLHKNMKPGLEPDLEPDLEPKSADEEEIPEKASATQLVLDGKRAQQIYLAWSDFSTVSPHQMDLLLEPIQVLIGEPDLDLYTNFPEIMRTELKTSDSPPKEVDNIEILAEPGQRHLPERIRIISSLILDSLEMVFNTSIQRHVYRGANPGAILLRPFKALVLYEPKLREQVSRLRENIYTHARSDGKPESTEEETTNKNLSTSSVRKALTKIPNPKYTIQSDDSIVNKWIEVDLDSGVALDSAVLLQLECLLDFLDTDIRPKINHISGDSCQNISFDNLWYLFQPGAILLEQGGKQAYRLVRVITPAHKGMRPWDKWWRNSEARSMEEPLKLRCVYVDFDGKRFGPVSKWFSISRFEGEKAVTSLPVYPLRFSTNKDIRRQLIDRSNMLLQVATYKPMYCIGHTLDTREEVDSQVVVDFGEALFINPHWKPDITPVSTTSVDTTQLDCNAACCRKDSVHDDSYVDQRLAEAFIQSLLPQQLSEQPSLIIFPQSWQDMTDTGYTPTEDELIIMTYRVFAFVLRTRKWAQLDITHLRHENDQNRGNIKTAFEHLVLPDGHKEMVQALVTQHFEDKEAAVKGNERSDLVRGKGKGLIILLHGAPGVGKTTTAEGIAEHFEKPLFQITCGDLGITPIDVQTELERNFSLASRWGCILLLDEADVFLAQRERKDLTRNALVAIFLRILEYYTGILFLTTNRVGDFDEAFASRIHMSLHYPALDENKTKRVFELNLGLMRERFKRQGRSFTVDEGAIIEFAKTHYVTHKQSRWNGRQIRNACETALALAQYEFRESNNTVFLQQKHFAMVQKAYLDFSTYLGEIYGISSNQRAKENYIRAGEDYGQKESSKFMKRAERSNQNSQAESSGQPSLRPTTPNINRPGQMAGQMMQQHAPSPQINPSVATGFQNIPVNQYGQHMYGQPAGISPTQMPLNFQGQVIQPPQQGWSGGPPMSQPQTQYYHPQQQQQQQQQQQYPQQPGFNPQNSQQSPDPTASSGTNPGST
ncbi:hypothetical protein F4774DRAFT_367390 [Daldinia eschscholtzii]|nr:hypothetical protein F4774DRAFT_367390 [Daldinia eschscholtzii]